MGRDERENKAGRLAVLESVRGHESTVAHSFNHTEGTCPKCGNRQHLLFFCAPDGDNLPRVRGCELDGEHLHRLCGACKYPWIERCLDQAMLAEQRGEMSVESEFAAALAVILEKTEGAELDASLVSSRRGWTIRFQRHPERRTLTLVAVPPQAQQGQPVHPQFPSEAEVEPPA